ncbi:hypothetical protein GRI34_00055 [Erythrobacter aquimaris]|uniref:Uncharacterized protein n=1 Tax=Qipengyuania aquimaris TaxID=255984 RepID=A0A6I4TI09_9SPHN|nr:hypothetical protein [Qipengyuania aquimaris]MXO94807.1 hypothetical protein [Qipengyuania aquimaris]
MQSERFLFAVEPETSTIIAKWKMSECATDAEVEEAQRAIQRRIGDEYVVLDSASKPEWRPSILTASDGRKTWQDMKGAKPFSLFRLLSELLAVRR